MNKKSRSKFISFAMIVSLTMIWSFQAEALKAYGESIGPEILITEVLPKSQNSDDAYEFVELYNNSERDINLKDYKMPSQNVDFTASKIIPSKGILVICTRSNTSLASFNSFFNTSIIQDKYETLPLVDEVLGKNLSESIIIAKDDGTVVSKAVFDQSNYDVSKSICYKYPQYGFDMYKLAEKQIPTPGSITTEQVPNTGTTVTGISLDKQVLSMSVNQSTTIYATVVPSTAINKSITWSSTDTNIVQVNDKGVITANKEGAAVIIAKTVDGGYVATCTVIVKNVSVTGITLNKTYVTIDVNKAIILNASIIPENATNKTLQWTSSDAGIATVDSNGIIVGKSQGTAVITVKTSDGNYSATCIVVVNNVSTNVPVTAVTLNKEIIDLKEGQSESLYAVVAPSNATNKLIKWSTDNAKIATIDNNGNVKAIKEGIAVITVTSADGNFKDKCFVVVRANSDSVTRVSGVSLNHYILYVKEGQSMKLEAKVYPENAKDKSVTWKTSNSKVATVSADGKVMGVNEGIAVITVTTRDRSYTDKCIVFVTRDNSKAKGNKK